MVVCGCAGRYFRADRFLFFILKLTIMSSKFAIIGVVSVLSAGAVMHHARFCPLQKMMAAIHHHNAATVVKATPAAPATPAKNAVAVVMR